MNFITVRDGRKLAYIEAGDPNGALVIHNHGGPSSRLEVLLFDTAAKLHEVRLVGVDRPGMGQSSPQTQRTFASWADDLTCIADTLGYQEFGVTGWSEGGPWALTAAAYIDPRRLRHVSTIAGGSYGTFGDNWAADHLSNADKLGGVLALRFRTGFHLMYAALEITATHFRSTYINQLIKAVNDYDREVLQSPEVVDLFVKTSAECFAHGSNGLVRDAECLYRAWPVDVTQIQRRVHFWQGLEDRLVPSFINQTVAERMPDAVWHGVAGAGHFLPIGSADELFSVIAEEMNAPASSL